MESKRKRRYLGSLENNGAYAWTPDHEPARIVAFLLLELERQLAHMNQIAVFDAVFLQFFQHAAAL